MKDIIKEFDLGLVSTDFSKRRCRVLVQLRLSYINKQNLTMDDKKVSGYWVLSIYATLKSGRGYVMIGQCLDTLAEMNDLKTNPKFIKLYKWWKRYHSNDLSVGVRVQKEFLKDKVYTSCQEACDILAKAGLLTVDGYRYGTNWRLELIPQNVIDEIAQFCKEK